MLACTKLESSPTTFKLKLKLNLALRRHGVIDHLGNQLPSLRVLVADLFPTLGENLLTQLSKDDKQLLHQGALFIGAINPDKLFSSVVYNCHIAKGRHQKKNRFFLGKSPKLWVGGGQES